MGTNKGKLPDRFDIDMRPLNDFMKKMDSFFNESFKQINSHFHLKSIWADVEETDSDIIVKAELPGYKRDQIHIEIIGNRLRISVDEMAKQEAKDNEKDYYNKSQSVEQKDEKRGDGSFVSKQENRPHVSPVAYIFKCHFIHRMQNKRLIRFSSPRRNALGNKRTIPSKKIHIKKLNRVRCSSSFVFPLFCTVLFKRLSPTRHIILQILKIINWVHHIYQQYL